MMGKKSKKSSTAAAIALPCLSALRSLPVLTWLIFTVVAAAAEQPSRLAQLLDPTTDLEARRAAATQWLNEDPAEAAAQFADVFASPQEPGIYWPLISALRARDAAPGQALFEPLLTVAGRVDEPVLSDVAALLGRYDGNDQVRRLIETACNADAPPTARLAAIGALSFHRTLQSAQTLIKLLDDQAVRPAAATALAELTGIDRFNGDAAKWKQWWLDQRTVSPSQWQNMLIANHARRSRRLERENRELAARVLDVQRQLYRASAQDQREPLLIAMLTDGAEATRLLAVELMVNRLMIDQQTFGPDLVAALLKALDDRHPAVRQRAAILLREIGDARAADEAARRLVGGQEQSPDVLGVYLLMMADEPRAVAIPRAMDLLSNPALRDKAAGVLARAAEQKLLTPQQRDGLKELLRAKLETLQGPPAPNVVELLGYVGDAPDWARIEQWLDAEQADVKEAAARAWRRSDRPLDALIRRSSDPVIQSQAISAATERGRRAEAMLAMLRHRPQQEQVLEAWRRAMEAMAGRATVEDVLRVDTTMARETDLLPLRDRMLSAALAVADPDAAEPAKTLSPQVAELRLRRADVRLKTGDAKAALRDVKRIGDAATPPQLTDEQRSRYRALAMATRLTTGDLDGAFDMAKVVLDQARTSGDAELKAAASTIASLFLDAADRAVEANQGEQARSIVTRLDAVVGTLLDDAQRKRLTDLQTAARDLARPQPPATGETPAPSAG